MLTEKRSKFSKVMNLNVTDQEFTQTKLWFDTVDGLISLETERVKRGITCFVFVFDGPTRSWDLIFGF